MAGLATAPPNEPECRSLLRAAQIDLEVDESAQAVADRRDAAVEHRRVGDDDDVGGELVLVGLDEVVEVRGADFFLALEDDASC